MPQLANLIGLAAYFQGAVLYHLGLAVRIGSCRFCIDCAVLLYAGAQSLTDASGTSDGIVVSDIADCQYIADDAVPIAVDVFCMLFDIVFDHLALEFRTLVCIKSYIVGLVVEVQSLHIQFSGGAVGGLSVEPYKGLILVCHLSACSRVRSLSLRSCTSCLTRCRSCRGRSCAIRRGRTPATHHADRKESCSRNADDFLCLHFHFLP